MVRQAQTIEVITDFSYALYTVLLLVAHLTDRVSIDKAPLTTTLNCMSSCVN